jgi:hypothetical protein
VHSLRLPFNTALPTRQWPTQTVTRTSVACSAILITIAFGHDFFLALVFFAHIIALCREQPVMEKSSRRV